MFPQAVDSSHKIATRTVYQLIIFLEEWLPQLFIVTNVYSKIICITSG